MLANKYRAFVVTYRNKIIIIASSFGALVVYFLSHLPNLLAVPIFTDEAIYLRWSQIMVTDASLRFLPLVDGKPPLYMWAVTVVMKILKGWDPLMVGRLVSVGCGLFGMMGVYFAAWQVFRSRRISLLSSLLYVFVPFTFFYDRFATADSLLAAFSIWSFGLGILLIKSKRLDVAMILGWAVGFGLLTKSTASLFIVLWPILFVFFFNFRARDWKLNLLKLMGLFFLAFVISQVMYSILRLFPLFNMINQKNATFFISYSEFFQHPFALAVGNLKTMVPWEFFYLTPMVSIIAICGGILGLRKHFREIAALSAYFLVTLLGMASLNKIIYPRYLLTFTPMVLVLAGYGLYRVWELLPRGKFFIFHFLFFILVFAWPVYIDFQLIFNPVAAPIVQGDRDQYLDGWAAGFGVKEIRAYLTYQAKLNNKMVIGTEGTFGLMPYSLELYQKDYPNMDIKSFWPIGDKVPVEIAAAAKLYPTYFIIYQRQDVPAQWKLEEVLRFREGLGNSYLRLYKVLPNQ